MARRKWWVLLLVGLALSACREYEPKGMSGNGQSVVLTRVFAAIPLIQPVAMGQRYNEDEYWYVAEQDGRIVRFANQAGVTTGNEFIDIRDRVQSGGEAGLLGMALSTCIGENDVVYLSYTRAGTPLTSVISRFISRDGGITLDPLSEQVLLTVDQPYNNHNGGNIAFGPDGFLYIGFGDGGLAGDPNGNGQNTQTLLGALLRIDVCGRLTYAIPPDNPFAQGGGGRGEIFAWGFRNPWRWSFDRANGELWLADVGQDSWEEVDRVINGGNYGWNLREGKHCYTGDCNKPGLIDPVVEYSHDEGCSITGGYVYRGMRLAYMRGIYFYADYCSGNVWGMDTLTAVYEGRLVAKSNLKISSFAQGLDGELYVLDHQGGGIYRLDPAP